MLTSSRHFNSKVNFHLNIGTENLTTGDEDERKRTFFGDLIKFSGSRKFFGEFFFQSKKPKKRSGDKKFGLASVVCPKPPTTFFTERSNSVENFGRTEDVQNFGTETFFDRGKRWTGSNWKIQLFDLPVFCNCLFRGTSAKHIL